MGIPVGSPALIDSMSTSLPDAPNLVLVFVQIYSAPADRNISAGNLEIRRGTLTSDPLIAENEFQIDLQHDGSAPIGVFTFLIGRDASPGANPTYGLFAGASDTGLNAEAKFLLLNDVPNADFVDGSAVPLAAGEVTLATLGTTLPDQPTVVVGAVQMEQTGVVTGADIDVGDLRLKRGAAVLASNQFYVETDTAGNDGDGNFMLLIARDASPGASPTYTVTADAVNDDQADAEAKIMAFSGLSSSFVDTGAVAVGTSRTVVGSTATAFPTGDDVLIGAFQMDTTDPLADHMWAPDSIDLARASNLNRASNELGMTIPQDTKPFDNIYAGLLNAISTPSANPTYEGAALAAGAGWFDMELKLVAIHVTDASGCSDVSVITSDPAGQLWFNETVEPDGIPFTTQPNVSASFQTGAMPALAVTNNGTGPCDVTLRLMTNPGTGRSMKFNTTNSAPWPSDASREIPLDPSSVTVCASVAVSGTCDIWLWADYENALGGQASLDIRVETQ